MAQAALVGGVCCRVICLSTSSRGPSMATLPLSISMIRLTRASKGGRWVIRTSVRSFNLHAQPLDQRGLGLRVHRAGRLVEDQDRRPAGERPGERDRLALAARQALAAVGEPQIVAVGDRSHEAVGAGKLGGAKQFVVVDMAAPEADILAHRAGQKHALLKRGADVAAHLQRIELADVGAVDHHQPFLGRIEAEDQPGDGRLAGADPAEQRDMLAGLRW